MQGSTLNTYKVMAIWMLRSRLLLQKLTSHISEVSNQSKLNFGLTWFLYGPNMCANFQRNLRGYGFFLLIWYGMTHRLDFFTAQYCFILKCTFFINRSSSSACIMVLSKLTFVILCALFLSPLLRRWWFAVRTLWLWWD